MLRPPCITRHPRPPSSASQNAFPRGRSIRRHRQRHAAGIFDTDLSEALPERMLEMHKFWCSRNRQDNPEELAEFAAFMVSDRNSYMIGEVVTVDGGSVT
ncbi:MAG: SDR family oxidoreductase [Acidobacteria bacterium]|nr:SDR family oxidoreductase [Acidobacteriota bacterium]